MWKLTIEDDEGKPTSLPLAHDEFGLGRAESNAIRLTDRNVSRSHAILKKNGQGWSVADLQSYNGTYVNGVRVAGEQLLHSGDVVQLGDYRLELVDDTRLTQPVDSSSNAPAPQAPIHQRPNRLVVVVGPTPGAEFPLDRDHFTIGRSEEATISVNHSSVSRVHAEVIAIGNGRFEIVDKGSANGIRINGVELKRGILEAGDALELGDVRLRFVGAGKIYKAFADHTAQVHPAVALGSFESVATSVRAPAMTKPGPSIGKLIGIGAAIGLLLIAVGVVVMRTGSGGAAASPSNTAKAAPSKADDAAIAEAKALLDKKDFDGAHKRLQDVPDGSQLRDDPEFKSIEKAWTDWMFEKASKASKNADRRHLLQEISTTPTVEPERRQQAAKMIEAMDAAEPPPPEATGANGATGAAPNPVAGNNGSGAPPATVARVGGAEPPPEHPVGAPKAAEPANNAAAANDPAADEAKQRKQLEGVVWSGKASITQIKILRAICQHQGDHACRDRAAAMLKKKTEE